MGTITVITMTATITAMAMMTSSHTRISFLSKSDNAYVNKKNMELMKKTDHPGNGTHL
jgi:hypothetical protein